jgi:hypothetical protein
MNELLLYDRINMKKQIQTFLGSILITIFLAVPADVLAYKKTSCSFHKSTTKSYTKKAPCAGLGRRSKVNGLPKTKVVSGHVKKTNKGLALVNPYARSK